MKNSVKNIIFDLGGVLLNIDYNAPIREFKKLGITNFEELYSKASQKRLFDEFETGKISPADFRNNIRRLSNSNHSDSSIDLAWNSILLDFPIENKELLSTLKLNYRLFLLSNTNDIHIACFEQNLVNTYKTNFLPDVFENIYYSSRIGLRKPAVEAFEFVLVSNNLKASETLFIDDSIQHIEGAMKAGLNTHWLDLKQTNTVSVIKNLLGS